MYEDKPKMITWLLAILLAVFFALIGYSLRDKHNLEWLMLFCWLVAAILAIVFAINIIDYIAYKFSARMYDLQESRIRPQVELANAIKELTSYQLDYISANDKAILELLANDDDPLVMVRCGLQAVPWEFVETFLQQSIRSDPYLFPVRDAKRTAAFQQFKNAEQMATMVTRMVIRNGWATESSGPFAARLNVEQGKTLDYVAKKLWVKLELKEVA